VGLARTAVKVTAAAADAVHRPPPGLVVLIYHRVGRRTPIEVDLPLPLFTDQIAELAATRHVVSLVDGLARLADRSALRDAAVAITFDDGTADFADLALPVLVQHGVPVTLYVATDFIERGAAFPNEGVPLTWTALSEALATGLVAVGSHTHTHSLLDRLPPGKIAAELDRSIELIGERTGATAAHFAYPKAVPGSPDADALVRTRFLSAALAGTRVNRAGADPYRLARSPVQYSDGMRWFRHKAAGGLGLEDTLRRLLNRGRYSAATT
jgi:peptidoglycan/xylan/chitin deacetylase (PgdA/CDA1 family)